ncbi:metallophosphoesterase [Haloferula chungangensis]|uniref:Metallophosphoesterase n=1 Tax=Haloferula chungangensis TaxID=1048331 RepID=A0ABW2L5K2_9BACT
MLILSDLHLGHAASRIQSAEQLRPLLEGAGTVVFNGDTFQELASDFRPRSEVLMAELRSLCEELGTDPVFLSGNHDPGWEGQGWVELAGGKIIATHGDSVMWGGSPWSRESVSRSRQLRELWAEHPEAEHDPAVRLKMARKMALLLRPPRIPKGRTILRRALDAINPPRRAFEILRVWWQQSGAAAEFLRHYFPQAEVLVVGHFHRRGLWFKSGRLVVNTGAFVHPHGSMWVSYENGWLRVGRVGENEGVFVRADPLTVWRFG